MEEVCVGGGGGGGGYMEQFAGTGLIELYVQYVCMHLCTVTSDLSDTGLSRNLIYPSTLL